MIDSIVDMCDVISGDSRQRIDAKILISGYTSIYDRNIERKHEYSSGDSRQQISLNAFSFLSANIYNGAVVGNNRISSGYSRQWIASNVLVDGFNGIFGGNYEGKH